MIRLESVGWAPGGTPILQALDLELGKGELTALVGRSGCGKSSLLRILAGLRAHTGSLTGVPLERAFVFQDPALLPWKTATENLALIGTLQNRPVSPAEIQALLARVGLGSHAHYYPAALSGGQRMRLSLARALLSKPQLVLLDEAFAALDQPTRRAIQRDVAACAEAEGWTVVMVTHDAEDARLLADRILLLEGPPLRVISDQRTGLAHPRVIPGSPLEGSQENREVSSVVAQPYWRWGWLSLPVGVGVWALVAMRAGPLLLPSPVAVAEVFWRQPGQLAQATLQTGLAAGGGLAAASLLGVGVAVFSWWKPQIRSMISPYLALLQVVPIVAIAPLLVVWLGYGMGVALTTALIAALYPIYAGAYLGLCSVPQDLIDLFGLYRAGVIRELLYLRLPWSRPALATGLETAAGLAVIGAIVGEFVGSNGDPVCLGYLVVAGTRSASPELSFAAIGGAGLLALGMRGVVRRVNHRPFS